MDFAGAWDALSVGDSVTVSDGTPPPSANVDGWPYKCWRSHNFTGTLVEKIDPESAPGGPPRSMRFELAPNEDGNVIGYQVVEGVGHSFTLGE